MYHASSESKDKTRVCWIITGLLTIERVIASYNSETLHWNYRFKIPKKGKNRDVVSTHKLYPYYPTLGNGNRSYWGDGPQYHTKKEALEARKELLIQVIKETKKEQLYYIKKVKTRHKEELNKLYKLNNER